MFIAWDNRAGNRPILIERPTVLTQINALLEQQRKTPQKCADTAEAAGATPS